MKIGIDIDNVISNFDENLLEEYLLHDKELRNTGIINKNAKYIRNGMFDWTKNEENTFYKSNIEQIIKNLDLIDGAKEYIDKLKNDGHIIYIITGRNNGDCKKPYTITKKWLKKHDIYYDKLIFTNSYNKKSKAFECKKNNIDILIDDCEKTCVSCLNNGITPLLMDTLYNRNSNLIRVKNWKEIYEFITNYNRKKIKVILDTDAYNECDDQFAIAYMLKSQNIFDVEAITVAPYYHQKHPELIEEGQEKSYNEILKISKWLDFKTKNKVFKGAMNYITNGYIEDVEAVNKIIEIALKNEKTYIMAIGAITNIALAIKKQPKIIKKIEVVWLGGNQLFYKDNLEYNFKQDIEAVKIVFESKVKLTIIPCKNVASNLITSIYELNHYLKDKNELCNYLIGKFYNDGYHGIQERRVIWDISVIAYLINKSWFQTDKISCPIINKDTSYKRTYVKHKINIVNYLDFNNIYKDLFKKLGE